MQWNSKQLAVSKYSELVNSLATLGITVLHNDQNCPLEKFRFCFVFQKTKKTQACIPDNTLFPIQRTTFVHGTLCTTLGNRVPFEMRPSQLYPKMSPYFFITISLDLNSQALNRTQQTLIEPQSSSLAVDLMRMIKSCSSSSCSVKFLSSPLMEREEA